MTTCTRCGGSILAGQCLMCSRSVGPEPGLAHLCPDCLCIGRCEGHPRYGPTGHPVGRRYCEECRVAATG